MSVVKHYTEVNAEPVTVEGASEAYKRLLLGKRDDVPRFSMRMFEVHEGGNTPFHRHDFEHEIYVVEGSGRLIAGDEEFPMKAGTVVYIPPMEQHQIINMGVSSLKFLCLVPRDYE